jgi:nucleotide-binding universal stress UspA family protein
MQQVLVGVDGSEECRTAVAFAAADARARGATLTAVLVVEPRHLFDSDVRTKGARLAQGRSELEDVIEAVVPQGDPSVEQRVEYGDPRRVLRELASGTDHLVIGARGTGTAEGLLLGSVSQYLVTHVDCPVTVTRATAQPGGPLERIGVGVDGSPNSLHAVEWACGMARSHGARLTAMIVAPPAGRDDAQEDRFVEAAVAKLDATIEAASGQGSVEVDHRTEAGDPREVLQQLSAESDLVVVGSRGHGRVTGALLGSVSHHLVHHAECHVTVVPPLP